MISAFRRLAGTWFAKALFVLLILSFAIWGIEDVVRNFGRDNAVARAGGDAIELPEAQAAARRETGRLLRQLGPNFESNEGFRQAIARQAVEGLIRDRASAAEARRLDVATSAAAIRDYTFAIPTFQGADGRFSPVILQGFLRQNELSESDFVRLVASDLRRQQLAGAVRAGARGPETMTRPLLAFTLERRAAEVVEFPLLSAPTIPEPTEAQLRRFHENTPERFSSPEYREAVLALVSADTLAATVSIPDSEIEAGLPAARARLAGAERRTVEHVLVRERTDAEAIRVAWVEGADGAAIRARAEAAAGTFNDLPNTDREGLTLPELGNAAFSAAEGGVTDVVQTPFGFHVLRVTDIQAAPAKADDELRAEVRADLAREKAADRAYEEANRLDDAFAGGATVEEAAARLNIPAARVRLDRQGNDESGRPVPLPLAGPGRTAAIAAVFANNPGSGGRLAEVAGGFLAVDVPRVTPAALRPFETVEADVRRWWLIDQQRRAQETRAAALLAEVQGGKDLAQAARDLGLEAVRMGPSPRVTPGDARPEPGALPRELLPGLFNLRVGEVTMAATAYGFAVAGLAEIIPVDLSDASALASVKTEVETTMQDDLEAQYSAALRARADVSINPAMMDQVAAR